MSNWFYLFAVEYVAVGWLLFALLTACVSRWGNRAVAITILAGFVVLVLACHVAAIAYIWPAVRIGTLRTFCIITIVATVILFIGFATTARLGGDGSVRRQRPQRPTGRDCVCCWRSPWPRSRIWSRTGT